MTDEYILQTVAYMRKIQMKCWNDYHEKAILMPSTWSDMRDYYEMNVRVLDYVMTKIRNSRKGEEIYDTV